MRILLFIWIWIDIIYKFCWLSLSLWFLVGLIEVGLMQVYVIGSHINLGKWKVQDGLKLSYAGDSIWQGDCVLRKVDLPIKYPSWCLNHQFGICMLLLAMHITWWLPTLMFISLFILDGCSTYNYSKYGKAGNLSLETGPNRELTVGSSKNQPRYIFLSDGMFRVCCQT